MSKVKDLKLKIMEIEVDLSCKEFAEKVVDEISKTIDNLEMKALLTSKLAQIKPQTQEEEKITDDAISVSQPQNYEDPYERAKQLIDQFQERMKELDQNQRILIKNMESLQEQRDQFMDSNDKLDQQFIQLLTHEQNLISTYKKRLQNKTSAEQELCANLQAMIECYCNKYKTHIFHMTKDEVIETKVPKNKQIGGWISYPPKEKVDKLPSDYKLQLKKVYWELHSDKDVCHLKFSFGKDLDQSDLKTDGMKVKEFQPDQQISKIEYWLSDNHVRGIRFLDISGQQIVMIGRQKDEKYHLDIANGNLRGIEVSAGSMFGLKVHVQEQKKFIDIVEGSE